MIHPLSRPGTSIIADTTIPAFAKKYFTIPRSWRIIPFLREP